MSRAPDRGKSSITPPRGPRDAPANPRHVENVVVDYFEEPGSALQLSREEHAPLARISLSLRTLALGLP